MIGGWFSFASLSNSARALGAAVAAAAGLAACGGGGGGSTTAPVTVAYTVAGSVSGLAGTGLVLQNSGGSDLAVASNGSFAFAQTLSNGAAYGVTVKTQPSSPAQTCVVGNGSGTVAGANIGNVTVTCTTNRYAVGGSVSGLAGGGLVLQNSAGDDLAVGSAGVFTFATRVASGVAFHVTVKSQPIGPSQTCTVNGGDGSVVGADITAVVIVCATNTYAVRGTVSGLVGNGLVLRNNGTDPTPIASNGTFSFASPVASGATYNVTVATQPSSPAQTCTVNAGSGLGTVTGADITNVAVVCSTNSYTVGGTVSGLVGASLVLQNNGGDDRVVTANGSFVFATPVASGAGYNVTVRTQPQSPSQTCTVNGGTAAGSVGAGNVASIVVVCATNAYRISGTASGVAGSGLELQNNGADDLSLAADGSFSFATPVASGAGYSVTVKTKPTAPAETCVVTRGSGSVVASDVTDVRIDCSVDVALAAYVTRSFSGFSGEVDSYAINPASGGLTALGAANAGVSPGAVVVTANGKFAYLANNSNSAPSGEGTVSPYAVAASTHALVVNGAEVAAGIGARFVAIHPSDKFLYVVDSGENKVTVLAIDQLTGRPSVVSSAPTGVFPVAMVFEPSGKYAYVANTLAQTVSSFGVNANTGALTWLGPDVNVAGTPFALGMHPGGKALYAANKAIGNVNVSNVVSLSIDKTTGLLTRLSGSVITGVNPTALAVHPSGKFAYVANYGLPVAGYVANGSISIYAVDASTGGLLPTTYTGLAGRGSTCLAVEASGRYAYLANLGSDVSYAPAISIYSIDLATGNLNQAAPDVLLSGSTCVATR